MELQLLCHHLIPDLAELVLDYYYPSYIYLGAHIQNKYTLSCFLKSGYITAVGRRRASKSSDIDIVSPQGDNLLFKVEYTTFDYSNWLREYQIAPCDCPPGTH